MSGASAATWKAKGKRQKAKIFLLKAFDHLLTGGLFLPCFANYTLSNTARISGNTNNTVQAELVDDTKMAVGSEAYVGALLVYNHF